MGVVYNIVAQYLPFIRRKPVLTRVQALSARPLRHPALKWERTEDGETRLLVPRRKDFVGRMLCRIFHAPEHKEMILDTVGSDVWEMCDGKHSVETIVAATCRKHNVTRRECETSVGAYLKMLSERRLIGFQLGGRRKK